MERLRRRGRRLGFVPTMGALHEGHLSLVRAAARENDVVVVSIFVNPAQFGPREDFKKYPRTFARDRRMLKKAGVNYLFFPSAQAIYPEGFSTFVEIKPAAKQSGLFDLLCGKSRPGHFRGVATVVTKLFHLAKPHRAYFGAKDYQQAMVIRRLIQDLDLDIALRLMPTVREKDGLAMSSRNRYLRPADRIRARALFRALFQLRRQIRSGRRNLRELRLEALAELRRYVDRIDYFEIADPETLLPLRKFQRRMVVLTACFVGKTRLIDNVIIQI